MSILDVAPAGAALCAYLFLGLIFAILREYGRGARARTADPEMFFAIIAFWPFVFPMLWLYKLARWVWDLGFNRNLPPTGQHPTARVVDRWPRK